MQEKYILEKCEIGELSITKEKINAYFENELNKYSDIDYLYWDKIKYKNIPEWFKDIKEVWWFTKFIRNLNYITPITTEKWEHFKFWELPFSKELLHEIDKNASWTFFTSFSDSDKKMFIANGMLEEAISSSQLEWASTTTSNAEKMIKQWRKPITKDEQMIMNNYDAMNYIKNDLVNKELEESDLLYLQSLLTKNTLESKDEEWRFRRDSDNIIVEFERKISHEPMEKNKLKKEIEKFIDFANNKWKFNTFVHPIIKAILIHFWIWYLHPFCDWNWRTARALFYWYVLRNDYFWFSFIPLSSAIKNTKKEYARSYIYSEQDDNDLTYFINYNLRKIQVALNKFSDSLKEKFKENNNILKELSKLSLNEREKRLVAYFLQNNDSFTNYITHKNYYNISKPTAISDLKHLEIEWYIYSIKSWRNVNYFPVDNIQEIVNTQKRDS